VGLRKHVLRSKEQFLAKDHARACPTTLAVSCAKMAEPIVMPFGLWTRVGPMKHVVDGVQIPHAKEQFLEKEHVLACTMTLFSEPWKSG